MRLSRTLVGYRKVAGLILLSVVLALCVGGTTGAQETGSSSNDSQEQREREYKAAVAAANAALIKGPTDVALSDKAILHLLAGEDWIPRAEADRYQRAMGHSANPSLLGIVSGGTKEHGWIAIVTFTGEGYVKDDEAAKLDPAAILSDLRNGQDQANERRVARGFSSLILDDWMQPPRYDSTNRWLIWALPVHTSKDVDHPTINYNTRALGREGYLSLNLLTDREHFDHDKVEAATLLKSVEYKPGHRYLDFNASTDKVAAYGLAALIGAVTLKKLGILALASAFIVKFTKVGLILLIGVFAAVKHFLFRGKRDTGA